MTRRRAPHYHAFERFERMISQALAEPEMGEEDGACGDRSGCIAGNVNGYRHLRRVYTAADTKCSGHVALPVSWDRRRGTVVSNESAEIARTFRREFHSLTTTHDDYCPARLRKRVDAINAGGHEEATDGDCGCGLAGAQASDECSCDRPASRPPR